MVRIFSKRISTTIGTEQCVQEKVNAVLQLIHKNGPLTSKQEAYCDELCVARFLKSKGNNVKKASKQLKASLAWRASLDIDYLTADEFSPELALGAAFVAGQDDENRPVLIVRMKPEHLASQSQKHFLRYLIFTMEVAIASMPTDVVQCVLLLDAGCLKKGSPGVTFVVQLLKMFSEHYPERVAKVFVVDPPPTFYLFWKGLGAFLDHGLREKLRFVSARKLNNSALASSRLLSAARTYSSRRFWTEPSELEEDYKLFSSSKKFLAASITRLPLPEEDLEAALSCSSAAALVADKQQARSLSFASPATAFSWPREPETLEFRSFRFDTGPVREKGGAVPSLREQSRRERAWADFTSVFHSFKREEPQHMVDPVRKERTVDLFRPYMSCYRSSYDEAAYRSLMKPPLGGLVSIVSPELKRQPSFVIEGRRMEVMLNSLNLES